MISLARARAIWLANQGLLTPVGGSLSELLQRTGWLRTLGGAEAYLAVFARRPSATVAEIDAALARDEIQVLPCVRGCVYALPKPHAALGLRVAASLARKRVWKDFEKVGVSAAEVAELQAAIIQAVQKGPLSTDGIRAALPKGFVRPLGEIGKKLGVSSALPASLRLLEFDGKLHRKPTTRMDSERYDWHLPTSDIFAGVPAEDDLPALAAPLLQIFLQQNGVATVNEFAEWSGLPKKECKVAAAGAERVELEGLGEAISTGKNAADPPADDQVAFLASIDNYPAHRLGARFLMDAEHHDRPCTGFGARNQVYGEVKNADGRFIIRAGRIVGLWEYDPDAKTVKFGVWNAKDKHPKMNALADQYGTFLREQLGHGLVFSLDSVGEQKKRLAALP